MNYSQYTAAELVGLAITHDVDTLVYEMSKRLQDYVEADSETSTVDMLETEIKELESEFSEVENYCDELELENSRLKRRLAELEVVPVL